MDEVLKQNGVYAIWPIYKEEINANQWHSICFGYDIENNYMYLVHNGKTQDNVTQPDIVKKVSRGFDTTMVERFETKKPWDRNRDDWHDALRDAQWFGNVIGWNLWPFSGYITDYQIFGHSLSTEEMHSITSCQSFPKGDIYSWDAADWEPYDKELQKNEITAVQYRMVNISKSSLCKTTVKYTFFPDVYSLKDSINLCRRFGGKIVDVSTTKKVYEVVNFLGDSIKANPKYDDTISHTPYSMYTDKKEFNVWIHEETGELPIDPLIWNAAEPNGGDVENCAHFWEPLRDQQDKTKWVPKFNDVTCASRRPVACEDIKEISIKFRGICRHSLIDTTFTMIEGDVNKKRFFVGNTGWRIFWDKDGEQWKLSTPKQNDMYGLHTEFSTYPIGKNYWSIVNDTKCTYKNPEKVLINMSPCNSSSFTCDDGSCIPMTSR